MAAPLATGARASRPPIRAHHTPRCQHEWRARLRACSSSSIAAAERDHDLELMVDAPLSATAPAHALAAAATTAPLSPPTPTPTRRATLLALAAVLAATTQQARPALASAPSPSPAPAALPTAPFSFVQPGPVAVPRRTLDLRFAVLLMRSLYDAVDETDAIAMPDFQVSFWKRREAEAESYSQLVSPLEPRKGQLDDPLYFDFISYSQALAADAALRGHPPRVFEEQYDECELTPDIDECPILTRVVRRDFPLDDADLPGEFWRRAGDNIYSGLAGGFRGETFEGVPAPLLPGASADEVASGFRALLGVMVAKGYALSSEVAVVSSRDGSGEGEEEGALELRVKLSGSATEWGAAALASRRSKVMTLHEVAALDGWLRASSRGGGGKKEGPCWRAVGVEAEFGGASRSTTWRLVRG